MNILSFQSLNSLILALLPVIAGVCAYVYQLVVQRLPASQRASLDQFATMAAQKVEQVYPGAGSGNKKDLATELVIDLFKSFHLPVPDPRAIDAAIESSVLSINQVQGRVSSGPDPLAGGSGPVSA